MATLPLHVLRRARQATGLLSRAGFLRRFYSVAPPSANKIDSNLLKGRTYLSDSDSAVPLFRTASIYFLFLLGICFVSNCDSTKEQYLPNLVAHSLAAYGATVLVRYCHSALTSYIYIYINIYIYIYILLLLLPTSLVVGRQ
mgnify:CR=1 FL=1